MKYFQFKEDLLQNQSNKTRIHDTNTAKAMNGEQKTRFRDRHVRYQYDLLHCLPSVTSKPDVMSGLYLKKFYNATKRYQLTLPTPLTDPMGKFCTRCGVVRVAGLNMAVKKHTNEAEDDVSLEYKCLYCSKTNKTLLNPQLPSPMVPSSNKKSRSNTPIPSGKVSKPDNKINNSSKAKARAKKRKNNSLSNLLSQKNKEVKNKSSGIFSLESFMQK